MGAGVGATTSMLAAPAEAQRRGISSLLSALLALLTAESRGCQCYFLRAASFAV